MHFLIAVYRVTLVMLLASLTACMVASFFYPLFRSHYSDGRGHTYRHAFYYFSAEADVKPPTTFWSMLRADSRDIYCESLRRPYNDATVLAVVAVVCGVAATCVAAEWTFDGAHVCLGVASAALAALAFVCATAVVGLLSTVFVVRQCLDSLYYYAYGPTGTGYHLAGGFSWLCIAAYGFFALAVMQGIALCLGCGADDEEMSVASQKDGPDNVEGS